MIVVALLPLFAAPQIATIRKHIIVDIGTRIETRFRLKNNLTNPMFICSLYRATLLYALSYGPIQATYAAHYSHASRP